VYWEEDKKKHLAPNIKKLINRFNMVAFWVTSMILKTPRLEDRAKVVTTLIKVAEVHQLSPLPLTLLFMYTDWLIIVVFEKDEQLPNHEWVLIRTKQLFN
jgi:hypothetical protein